MKVFKFGGASVKDADGVKNVAKIIRAFPSKDLIVIISAMGKMTNAFEALMEAYTFKPDDLGASISKIRTFHFDILDKLDLSRESRERVEAIFSKLEKRLERPQSDNFDYDYDQIVSYGEVLSTTIISSFLNENDVECHWADARLLVRTDSTYREARVDWEKTETLVSDEWSKVQSQRGDRK